MDNNSEEQQKLANSLNSSLSCNFYNEKENVDIDWQLFLESKLVKCFLSLITAGIYPIYEFTKRHQHNASQKFNNCVTKIQNLNDEEINKRQAFFNNLTDYINFDTHSAVSRHTKKTKSFYIKYLLIHCATVAFTGGLYLLHLAYKHARIIKIHNSLNAIIAQYKKDNKLLKQKIMKERIYKEKEIADNLNESLKEIHGFNYDNCLHESLNSKQEDFEVTQRDPFLIFLVGGSYILLNVLTLGGFLIYTEYQKRVNKVQYNFFDQLLTKEIVDKHDFNIRVNSLANNYDINFDYAAMLSQKSNVNSNALDYTSLFRSPGFKNKLNTFWSLCFLNVITLGIYPLYIFYKVAFHNTQYFLLESYADKIEFLNIKDSEYFFNKLKVKFKVIYDFYFDAKMSIDIAATKLLRSTTISKIKPTQNDIGCLFVRTITSPIFKWAATLILLLTNYALWLAWIAAGAKLSIALFPVSIVFSVLFVIAIAYHLFLLF